MKTLVFILSITALTLVACGESDPPATSREEAFKDKRRESIEDTAQNVPPPEEPETADPENAEIAPHILEALNHFNHMPLTEEQIASLDLTEEQIAFLEAFVDAEAAVQHDPTSSEAHLALALALDNLWEYDRAFAAYNRAIALDPHNLYAYYKLGICFLSYNSYADAFEVFHKMVELHPNSAEAYKYLGLGHDDVDEIDAAIAALNKSVELNPYDAEAQEALGRIFMDIDWSASALTAYRKAFEINPSPENSYHIGLALYDHERYEEAVVAYRRALELGGSEEILYDAFAEALIDQDKFSEAEGLLRAELALYPDRFENVVNTLANSLEMQDKFVEAGVLYREAIVRKPDKPDYYEGLGRVLQKQLRTAEAQVALDRARQLRGRQRIPSAHSGK